MDERFSEYGTMAVVALLGVMVFRPGGVVTGLILDARLASAERASIANVWPTALAVADRTSDRAEIDLIEVMDYECPSCREVWPTIKTLAHDEGGALSIAVVHLPLAVHPYARPAAIAAICADEQSTFQEFHALLLETEQWRSRRFDWSEFAESAGVKDGSRFSECIGSQRARSALDEHEEVARALGTLGTPTFVSRRGRVFGVPSADDLLALSR